MKRYRIFTLGCRTNQYESAAYESQLQALGFERSEEVADLYIINSCTVTERADRDSRKLIRRLARDNPKARIVATGCMVEAGNVEGATDLIPNQKKEELIARLFPGVEELPEFKIERFPAHTRAFVKVQDGCNSFCTYCIIPYVRGRSRSRPVGEVLREIEGLVAKGYKEIVITGINVGDFPDLAGLIRRIDAIEGLERIRVSSIDPDEVDEELASAILEGKKTCPSMHIVLQAGSNVTLKRMNRKYTKQQFFETIDRLRAANLDFTFTTDVIVGFPGEAEEDFQQTLEVVERVRFAKVHLFPYSPRERTRAALYPNQVPPDVMRSRKQELLRCVEQQAFHLREEFVGRRMRVLVEQENRGYTENFLPVELSFSARPNEIVEVDLIKNSTTGLVGA